VPTSRASAPSPPPCGAWRSSHVGCLGGVPALALSSRVTTRRTHGVGCLGGVLALSSRVTTRRTPGVGCLGGVPPVRPRPPSSALSRPTRDREEAAGCFIGAASALLVTIDRTETTRRPPVRGLRPAGVAGAHPAKRRRLATRGHMPGVPWSRRRCATQGNGNSRPGHAVAGGLSCLQRAVGIGPCRPTTARCNVRAMGHPRRRPIKPFREMRHPHDRLIKPRRAMGQSPRSLIKPCREMGHPRRRLIRPFREMGHPRDRLIKPCREMS
jgi:hypothetical protein